MSIIPFLAHSQSAQGQLKNGQPVGVWEYYEGKELSMSFDYDSSRIKYIRPDTSRYNIQLGNEWQAKRVQRPPRVLGSINYVTVEIQRQLRYPIQDIRSRTTGTVVVAYVIDEQGKKGKPVVVTTPSSTLAQEVARAIESVPVIYIPAVYQGQRVPAKITLVVRFCLCKAPEECQQMLKAQAQAVPKPLGFQGEVIVTSY